MSTYRCGHRSQIARDHQVVTREDGTTELIPLPQIFRARGRDARYCLECCQVVDRQDDAEAQRPEAHQP